MKLPSRGGVFKALANARSNLRRLLMDGSIPVTLRRDEDGYIFIVDRKKDLIICGGYNIYPREIEELLFTHPAVLEAAVIGIPDKAKGEIPKAFVVLKPGKSTSSEEMISFCKERLAAYKVPRIIEFCEELPKSATGKILKRKL